MGFAELLGVGATVALGVTELVVLAVKQELS